MKYLNPDKSIKLPFSSQEIFKIKTVNEKIFIMLKCGTLHIYDKELNLQRKIKIPMPKRTDKYTQKINESLKRLVDFNESYAVVSIKDTVIVYNLIKASKVLVVEPNRSHIFKTNDVSMVNLKEKNVIISTDSGRSLVYSFSGTITNVYPRFVDSVEYVHVGKKYISQGSFDGRIKILNKNTSEIVLETRLTDSSPIVYIREISGSMVLFGFRNGDIYFINPINKESEVKSFVKNPITHLEIIDKYILIFQEGKFSGQFFEIETGKSPFNFFNEDIPYLIKMKDSYIIINKEDLKSYSVKNMRRQLIVKLKTQENYTENYRELEFLTSHNFLIEKKDQIKKKLYQLLERDKEKATKLFSVGHIDVAEQLLNRYKYLKDMKKYIDSFLENGNSFESFLKSFNNRNYHTCYEMAKKIEFLKYTKEYKLMEFNFKKIFARIYKNPSLGKDLEKVNLILAPYRTVFEKRKQINYILNKAEILHKFNYLINNKKFGLAFVLVEKHDILKELDIYKDLEEEFSKIYENILKSEDIEEDLRLLKLHPSFKEEALKLEKEYHEYLIFRDKILNGRTLDNFPLDNYFIENSEEYKKIIEPFNELAEKIRFNISKLSRNAIVKFTKEYNSLYFERIKVVLVIESLRSDINLFIEENKDKNDFEKELKLLIESYESLIGNDQYLKDLKLVYGFINKADYAKPVSVNYNNINIEDLPNRFYFPKKIKVILKGVDIDNIIK